MTATHGSAPDGVALPDRDETQGRRVHLARLDPRTYRHDAAALLRAVILNGDLPAGSPLVERRIADDMGISRAPVREALRTLEEEGLVVTIPYKGSYVNRITPETMDEILSLRTVLEGFAAERALPELRAESMASLRSILSDMRAAAAAGREDGLVTAHLAFHRVLYERSRHSLLLQFWNMMEGQLRLYGAVHQHAYESLEDYAAIHQGIIDMLERASIPAIKAHLALHMQENTEPLLHGRARGPAGRSF